MSSRTRYSNNIENDKDFFFRFKNFLGHGRLEYHCMTFIIQPDSNKIGDSSYLMVGLVATLGTRQGVLSTDEVEVSMSMSIV